jgi:F-type H+-transporting ATPase subunit epsilon
MLKLKIVTPEKTIYQNEIFQISVPTTEGEVTILPHHIPLISVLKAGEMRFKDASGDQSMAVSGGFLEVRGKNEIVILADHAERSAEIDLVQTEAAHKKALEQMEKLKNSENVDFARLQAAIDRETNKLKVAKKYRTISINQQ